MAREWTERHIRELIARSGGGGATAGYCAAIVPTLSQPWYFIPLPETSRSEVQNYDYIRNIRGGSGPLNASRWSHAHGIWIGYVEGSGVPWSLYRGNPPSTLDEYGNVVPTAGTSLLGNILNFCPQTFQNIRPVEQVSGTSVSTFPVCPVFWGCSAPDGGNFDPDPPPLTYTLHQISVADYNDINFNPYFPMSSLAVSEDLLDELESMTTEGADIDIKIYTASSGLLTTYGRGYNDDTRQLSPTIKTGYVNDIAQSSYLYNGSAYGGSSIPLPGTNTTLGIGDQRGAMAFMVSANGGNIPAGYYWFEANHFTTTYFGYPYHN